MASSEELTVLSGDSVDEKLLSDVEVPPGVTEEVAELPEVVPEEVPGSGGGGAEVGKAGSGGTC